MRILYDSKNLKYKSPFGCIKEGELCVVNIEIPSSCSTVEVYLRMQNDHSKEESVFELSKTDESLGYDRYTAEFSIDKAGLYFYYFDIKTTQGSFSLYKEGYRDTNMHSGDKWQLSCIESDFEVPRSFCGRVMYQIFPDRFNQAGECDLADKLTPYYIHEDKDDIPDYAPDEEGRVLNCDFYGGNLRGIEEKLPYLKSLGVSIIYLNPIFKAYSNHRYDTCDYKMIDPMLGTKDDFTSLCHSAHRLGMKIILDGVFSHTGSNSIYFDKKGIFGKGAYSDSNSPYMSWYDFESYPDKYTAWWGIDTLPAVNELDEGYLDYIIRSEDSVIEHWLNAGADGFRLDVADELPDEFIRLLRKRVKEIKKDSFVVGEVWEDASNKISYSQRRKYFVASELDSVMNYVYKNAIIAFVCKEIGAEEFADRVMTLAENYPSDSLNSLMNSLSTHDTARILTVLGIDSYPETKAEQAGFVLNEEQYIKAQARLYTAVFLQYILPGTACIYYGDEIGMQGFGDPFCRGYFRWNDKNCDILNMYMELGKIKNKYKSLQIGDIHAELDGDALIFRRRYNDESFTAVINMGDTAYALENKKPLISHHTSAIGNKLYINKDGFAAFVEMKK